MLHAECRVTNYKLLMDMLSSFLENSEIRIAITERITEIINDENVLEKIFFDENSSFEMKKVIVQKIKSEIILKKIILSFQESELKKLAVEKLTNESTLLSIANELCKLDDCYGIYFAMISDVYWNREVILAIIPKLSKEKIKQLKSNDWYINAVCEDILNNQ